MDFSWSPEQLQLRERVVEFAGTLGDDMLSRDRAGEFDHDAWRACGDFGIQSMAVPAAYNASGADTDVVTAALVMEALGYGCRDGGLNMALSTHMWTVQRPIVDYGSEDQKRRYLPAMTAGTMIGAHALTEPAAGSDHSALQTTATRAHGGYVLSGTKQYITLGPLADVVLVFATTDPDNGRWGMTAFLVETASDGCDVSVVRDKMGLRTVPMGDVVLDGCFVPEDNRLGPEGAGASMASGSLAIERGLLLATTVGALDRQLERAIAFAQQRHQFGKPIGKFQSVSNRIADMKLKLETARLLLYKLAWMIERGESVAMEAAMLKLHLSETMVESSLDAIRIHGGAGYLTDEEVERDLRDAVGGVLFAGTSDIQRVLIARMLGL